MVLTDCVMKELAKYVNCVTKIVTDYFSTGFLNDREFRITFRNSIGFSLSFESN